MKRPLVIKGMHGLGDNLHQRAVVRELMERHTVWLETPWPCVYHDLVGEGLRLIGKSSSLRTQAKNARRERHRYSREFAPRHADHMGVAYSGDMVRAHGSVLGAMMAKTGTDVASADFRLPIPNEWDAAAAEVLTELAPTKPLLIFRPLIERTEWSGCAARNPDPVAYAMLLAALREEFFVISVADLEPGKEWLAGPELPADAQFHAGELPFETLAALTARADLVMTSPGFAAILAQAVGTAAVVVFGGYENSSSFSAGARFAPYLGIDPITPCDSFRHEDWDKSIDMEAATAALADFVVTSRSWVAPPLPVRLPAVFGGRPARRQTMKLPAPPADLNGLPERYMNPGELETLIALVASVDARVMIEIGTNAGRTAKAVLRNVPGLERYVGIDVPPSYQFAKYVQRNEAPSRPGELALDDPRFRLLLARRGTFDLDARDLPACDVVFIDGDHSAEAVRADHMLAKELVRPGGLIIHHDDHDLGTVDVRAVLDALHDGGEEIIHVEGTWLAFQNVAEVAA